MKKNNYTDIICRRFCRFYKGGREELTCGTYNFLLRNLTAGELKSSVLSVKSRAGFPLDEELRALACEQCDFLADGCDFRAGLDSPPCGGYAIIEQLLREAGYV